MYVNIYPTKCKGITTATFGRLKCPLAQNFLFEVKTYDAGKASTELLILVLDFKVNYRLKISKGISMECMECLNKGAYV